MSNRFRAESGGRVSGQMTVPGDKSISHRALLLSAISEGRSQLSGFLEGEDCLATLQALRALGVSISHGGDGNVLVDGVGMHGLQAPEQQLDMGNSGTAMRLLTGLLSAQNFSSVLTGDNSLLSRPMERVAAPLRQMGATVTTTDGRPPIHIAPAKSLKSVDYELPVASAQVKSAILLAGLYADGVTKTTCPGVTRDHTERMLAGMGVAIEFDADARTVALQGTARLAAMDLEIPGDFSSAAFFIVAGLIGAGDSLEIRNVGLNPTRTGMLSILRDMGAQVDIVNERIATGEPVGDLRVRRSALSGVDINSADVASAIDEFPVIFIAAACAAGTTRLRGAEELRHKESDRIATMAGVLSELGVAVTEHSDGIDIVGGDIRGGTVDSCGDHRVAMAAAVASLGLGESHSIEVLNTEEVNTSFPGFIETAAAVGLRVHAGGTGQA